MFVVGCFSLCEQAIPYFPFAKLFSLLLLLSAAALSLLLLLSLSKRLVGFACERARKRHNTLLRSRKVLQLEKPPSKKCVSSVVNGNRVNGEEMRRYVYSYICHQSSQPNAKIIFVYVYSTVSFFQFGWIRLVCESTRYSNDLLFLSSFSILCTHSGVISVVYCVTAEWTIINFNSFDHIKHT